MQFFRVLLPAASLSILLSAYPVASAKEAAPPFSFFSQEVQSKNRNILPAPDSKPASIPILMYHYIRPMPGPKDRMGQGLTVTPATFEKQLQFISNAGYHTVTFAELLNTGALLPLKPMIITFDDGYEDAYTAAFPLLQKYNMKAVFYIITDFPGTTKYASWDQIKQMSGSGMEIGAHTMDHFDLAKMSIDRQKAEIDGSKKAIETMLGTPVLSLAYPTGKYNADTVKIVRAAKIPYAVTTQGGIATQKSKHLELPRVRMTERVDLRKVLK